MVLPQNKRITQTNSRSVMPVQAVDCVPGVCPMENLTLKTAKQQPENNALCATGVSVYARQRQLRYWDALSLNNTAMTNMLKKEMTNKSIAVISKSNCKKESFIVIGKEGANNGRECQTLSKSYGMMREFPL